jgi:NADPH-ferrihemoprotein reductase
MAKEVHTCLEHIVAEFGKMEEAKAVEYVKKLQTLGRYSCDVWS